MAEQRCPDCHVQPGQPHDLGCDMARCPACGIQRLQCDAHGDDRALDARAVWTGAVPAVADDYRQRCADAAMKAWSTQAVLCAHSQIIPIGSIVDAVLAERHGELEQLRRELYVRTTASAELHKAADRAAVDSEQQRRRADTAEAANARVRAAHPEHEGRCVRCVQWCNCMDEAAAGDPVLRDLEDLGLRWTECPHGHEPYPCPTIRALDGQEPDHG